MSDQGAEISGPERAAILMMSLGESSAAEVLKHMDPKEVQKVGTAMASLSNLSNDRVEDVLRTFADVVEDQSNIGVDTDEYIRKMLVTALGENKAGGVIDRILAGKSSKGLDSLKWMDPQSVADVVSNEHPQIIAIVLSYLDRDHAAEVLGYLDDKARSDVLMRIATLDDVPQAAIEELNAILEKQFNGGNNTKNSGVGGVKIAAEILNFVDNTQETEITEAITEHDAELAQAIQDQMFVFENLLDIDDRGMQTLLRDVQSDQLIIALKGADDAVQEKIFKNMSSRAAEMMRDDLEAKGPVKLKEVEDAQKGILEVARKLADAGDISLGGSGGDEYV